MATKSQSTKSEKGPKELAKTLRSAASALEHGRHATARKKINAIPDDYFEDSNDYFEEKQTNSRVFKIQITEDESDALLEVLGRGQDDAASYLLTGHAKSDFGDEYADHLTIQADIFGQVASVLRKLKLPVVAEQWKEFADELSKAAKEEVVQP